MTDNGEAMAGFARTILAAHDEAVSYFTGSAIAVGCGSGAADELALASCRRSCGVPAALPRVNLELTVPERLAGPPARREPPRSDLRQSAGRFRSADWSGATGWSGWHRTGSSSTGPARPVISYHAPSLTRSAAIHALEAGATNLDRIPCKRGDQRRPGGHQGRHRDLRARLQPGTPDLRSLGSFGCPPCPTVEMALVAEPRSANGPVEALRPEPSSICRSHRCGPRRRPEQTGVNRAWGGERRAGLRLGAVSR